MGGNVGRGGGKVKRGKGGEVREVDDIDGECNKEPQGGICYSWQRALHTKEYIKSSSNIK